MAASGYAAYAGQPGGSPVTEGSPGLTLALTASPPTPPIGGTVSEGQPSGNQPHACYGVSGARAEAGPQLAAIADHAHDSRGVAFQAEGSAPDGTFARATREYSGTSVETTRIIRPAERVT